MRWVHLRTLQSKTMIVAFGSACDDCTLKIEPYSFALGGRGGAKNKIRQTDAQTHGKSISIISSISNDKQHGKQLLGAAHRKIALALWSPPAP